MDENALSLHHSQEETTSIVPPWALPSGASAETAMTAVWAVLSAQEEELHVREGERVPSYRLVRLLGRGGMGEVWEASQLALDRFVAVKRLIGGGGAAEEILSQRDFRREALIAARLEHPNIVPVHDLGEDSNGSPLIAMKLVNGRSWDELLKEDFGELPVEEFLARHLPILVSVGQALAFAHSKGIVHRDVKPSQVMIGEFGEALLMDWGLALLWQEKEPERTGARIVSVDLPTPQSASNPAGTPALMAPEQTESTAENIGPWTDVYLLGGTLYYLLVGRYPHSCGSSAEAVKHAQRGIVTAPEDVAMGRQVPRQLSALAMESLKALPILRPKSAREFVDRLRDYLSGASQRRESEALTEEVAKLLETVRPGYEVFNEALQKLGSAQALWGGNPAFWPLRDRALEGYTQAAIKSGDLLLARLQCGRMSAGATRDRLQRQVSRAMFVVRTVRYSAVTMLIIVIAGSYFSNRIINTAREQAESERRAAIEQRALSEGRFQDSRQLVTFMMSDLSKSLLLDNPREKELADAIADKVVERAGSFDVSKDGEASRLQHAEFLLDVGNSLDSMARYSETLDLVDQSRAILRGLGRDRGDLWNSATTLRSSALKGLGRIDEALAESTQAADEVRAASDAAPKRVQIVLGRQAQMFLMLGRHPEAIAVAEEVLKRLRDAGLDATDELLLTARIDYGNVLHQAGLFERARMELEQVLADMEVAGETDSERHHRATTALATSHAELGQPYEALRLYDRAHAGMLRLLGDDHPDIASILGNIGAMHHMLKDYDKSLEYYQKSLETKRLRLSADHPSIATSLSNVAGLLDELGRHQEALQLKFEALDLYRRAYGESSIAVAREHVDIANTYDRMGMAEESFEHHEKGIAVLRESGVEGSQYLAAALEFYGGDLTVAGRVDEAITVLEEAMELRRNTLESPGDTSVLAHPYLAKAVAAKGDMERALALYEEYISVHLASHGRDEPPYQAALRDYGRFLVNNNRLEAGLEVLLEAHELCGQILGPDHIDCYYTATSIADAYEELGNGDEALKHREETVRIASLQADGSSLAHADALTNLATTKVNLGLSESAVIDYERALEIRLRNLPETHSYIRAAHTNLAVLAWRMGRYEASIFHYSRIVELTGQVHGPSSVELVSPLINMAAIQSAAGLHEDALAASDRALACMEGTESEARLSAQVRRYIGQFAWAAGNRARALEELRAARVAAATLESEDRTEFTLAAAAVLLPMLVEEGLLEEARELAKELHEAGQLGEEFQYLLQPSEFE